MSTTMTPSHTVGRHHLEELVSYEAGSAVTIAVPMHSRPDKRKENELALRAAAERAASMLTGEGDETEALRARLKGLHDEEHLIRPSDGIILYLAPGFERAFALRGSVEDHVSVGSGFHTRPLMRYVRRPEHFYVMYLAQKDAHAWVGTEHGVIPFQIPDAPSSVDEFLGAMVTDTISHHAVRARGTEHTEGGIIHGHGSGEEDEEGRLHKFFKAIDDAMVLQIHGDDAPVILSGDARNLVRYRALSRLEHIAEDEIHGNAHDLSERDLTDRAYKIALDAYRAEADELLAQWERAFGAKKAEGDLAAIGKLAVQGRVRTLMIAQGESVPGTYDREFGQIEFADGEEANGIDLLDEIAEIVWMRGGKVIEMPAEQIPTQKSAAAILR